jgi:hypothetical protein
MGLTDANSCAATVRITRIRAEIECECAHGYACSWTGRTEGFDPSGVCVRICADVGGMATAATRTDGACTAMTQRRAQREDLGEAVFMVEVAKKVRTWGRWLDGHTCAGALGFAARARRNVEHGHRQVKQGLGPSIACIRVRAEHRRRSHGSDTKLMACTRQGKKERGWRGTDRRRWLGINTGERPRGRMSARAQVRPGRIGPRPGGGVCGQNVGGIDMAMAQRRRHAYGKGRRRVDGKRGSMHDEGLSSHDSRPKKGKALVRWRVLSCVGAGGKPKLGDARRTKK